MVESTMEQIYTNEGQNVETKEISVYRALSMRKIYAAEIEKLKGSAVSDKVNPVEFSGFVTTRKQSELANTEEFERLNNNLKSKYDKMMSLYRNFFALNAAIQQSNAETKITVGDKTYTIAEAISRYDRINAEINFYNAVAQNVANSVAEMEDANSKTLSTHAIETYVNNSIKALPEGTVITKDEIEGMKAKYKENYIKENTTVLVDPYNLRDKIDDKLSELAVFASQFNEAINAANLTTKISVNLVGEQ